MRGFLGRLGREPLSTALNALLLALICGCLYYISSGNDAWRDLTRLGEASLSEASRRALSGLSEEVEVWAFPLPAEASRYRSFLESYARVSPKVRYHVVNPEREPMKARELGVRAYGDIVVVKGDQRILVDEVSEARLTNAIVRAARGKRPLIAMASGHGEASPSAGDRDGGSNLASLLRDRGFEVLELNLLQVEAISDEVKVLLALGPRKEAPSAALGLVEGYVRRGGSLVLALDPDAPKGWRGLAEGLAKGLRLLEGTVLDPASRALGGEGALAVPIGVRYPAREVLGPFDLMTFFPFAGAISVDEEEREWGRVKVLVESAPSAWLEVDALGEGSQVAFDEGKDVRGPLVLGAMVDVEGGGRVALFADSDFARNAYSGISGNGELLLRLISHLAGEEDLVKVERPKDKFDIFYFPTWWGRWGFWTFLAVLPGLFLALGALVFWLRRRR